MEFYELVSKYESNSKSIILTNCYNNKLLYNCRYDDSTEFAIRKYLSILSFNKLNL